MPEKQVLQLLPALYFHNSIIIHELLSTLSTLESSIEEWNWFNLIQLLSIPKPNLLKGVYSTSTINSSSFNVITPLTIRLKNSDLILYSLLSILIPSPTTTLPRFPNAISQSSQTLTELKSFRAELGKQVEKVLKVEKESGSEWAREAGGWRRSLLDESKGEKWERILFLLSVMALRKVMSNMGNVESVKIIPPREGKELYDAKVEIVAKSFEEKRSTLAALRLKGFELLQANAAHSSSQSVSTAVKYDYSDLDLAHLSALRDQKVKNYSIDLWSIRDQASLNSNGSFIQSTSFAVMHHHSSSKSSLELLVSRHQQLLAFLKGISDPPLPQRLPATSDSTITSPSLVSSPLSKIVSLPISSIPSPPLFDFDPLASVKEEPSQFSEYVHLLLPPTISATSIELGVATLLDSLIPSPPIPSPAPIESLSPSPPSLSLDTISSIPPIVVKPSKIPPLILKKQEVTTFGKTVFSPRGKRESVLSRVVDSKAGNENGERVDESVRMKGRLLGSDLSTRSIGMGKEVESLLDELLDDSGLLYDDDNDDSF